jgi:phosphohistidine swiveling domain-containing protein
MNPELKKLLEQEWYIQGFAAKPGFLASVFSIDTMYKRTGLTYNTAPLSFKEDYNKTYYPERDLKEHADIIIRKLKENPSYLEETRELYNKEIEEIEADFRLAEEKSSGMTNAKLLEMLPMLESGLERSLGTAHIIEGISMRIEKNIYDKLGKKSSGKELNQDFSTITSPLTRSYLSKKEERLWQIKNTSGEQQEKLIKEFISDFFWLRTNFTGSEELTSKEILEEAKDMKAFEKPDSSALKEQKEELFKKYEFSEKEKLWLQWAEVLTGWQDDRKRNMFRAVFATDTILKEISKRYKVELKDLHYLLPSEIAEALKNKTVEKIAAERRQGCIFVKRLGKVELFGKEDFLEFEKASKEDENHEEILTGMSASLGTVTGPVKICTTIESLEKVKEGDILVASMTRPEFVTAMQKAAAIVTDEGGILSHAAIVSRELGIPCVVGTKNATKVLKDGDIVEVKANHGSVRKLKNKNS